MIEYENSKSDDQLEELLLLTEQMQEELDQKDRTIEELRVQLDESLTLNERLMVILVSMAIAIYFADWIRTILPVNLLFLLLLVQVIYVVIRWYVKGWRETRGYY